jgi:hypothetical protein
MPLTIEEVDNVDSEEDEESFLEGLTTPATEFPMPIRIPSSYVKIVDL